MLNKILNILKKNYFLPTSAVIFSIHLILSYWGVWRYHYLVAPGDDIFAHWNIIVNRLLIRPEYWSAGGYPPGFHYLIIGLSNLFSIDVMSAMARVWPALLVASGLAIFFLALKLFSKRVGQLAYFLYALVSLQPLQTATDGGLPNILASGVYLPINLIFWYMVWTRKGKILPLIGFIVTGLLIVWTHHFSTLVWLVMIIASATILSARSAVISKGWKKIQAPSLLAVGLAILIYLYTRTDFFGAAKELEQLSVHGAASPVWGFRVYSQSFSGVVFQFSAIGLLLLGWSALKRKVSWTATIIVATWYLLYFIGSRQPWIIEPGRLARDMSLPASILAAYGIVEIYQYFKNSRTVQFFYVTLLTAILIPSFLLKVDKLISYEPMVRFSTADEQLLEYIKASNRQFAVLPKVRFWEYFAKDQLASGKTVVAGPSDIGQYLPLANRCVAVSVYRDRVWLPKPKDNSDYDLASRSGGVEVAELADPNKIWYVFCKK